MPEAVSEMQISKLGKHARKVTSRSALFLKFSSDIIR